GVVAQPERGGRGDQPLAQRAVERLGHGGVDRAPGGEGAVEGGGAGAREVDELVEDHEVPALDLRAQAADRGGGEHVAAAGVAQRRDVGAIVHAARRDRVSAAVPGEQHARHPCDLAAAQRRAGRAPRRRHLPLRRAAQDRRVVEARAADDADAGHRSTPSARGALGAARPRPSAVRPHGARAGYDRHRPAATLKPPPPWRHPRPMRIRTSDPSAPRASEITDRRLYLDRRRFLAGGAAAAGALLLGACSPDGAQDGEAEAPLADAITDREAATSYNNFFEFGPDKEDPAERAPKLLRTRPWSIAVEGEVAKPGVLDI